MGRSRASLGGRHELSALPLALSPSEERGSVASSPVAGSWSICNWTVLYESQLRSDHSAKLH